MKEIFMKEKLDKKKDLSEKIEIVRKLLHKKIEGNADKEQIQQISEALDKLIVDYFKK
jgi:hypothetical protein